MNKKQKKNKISIYEHENKERRKNKTNFCSKNQQEMELHEFVCCDFGVSVSRKNNLGDVSEC